MPVTRLADLPLARAHPLDLLALRSERLAPDREYAGFGWAWVSDLELAAPARPSVVLPRALVLALHGADEQVEPDDIELGLELPGQLVRAPLSRVLAAKLPGLPAAAEIVLALCNPARTIVAAPPALRGARLHYAWGDVTSWLDRDEDGGEHVRLSGRRWLVAQPPTHAKEAS
jgi:hypothetical protein